MLRIFSPLGRVDGAEEYKALFDQLNQLQQNVRTLWASGLGFYIAALGAFCVVLSNLYKGNPESSRVQWLCPLLDWGGANVMGAILLGIIAVMLYLGYMWQRLSYRVGSYIQVFYEQESSRLQWITRNRGVQQGVLSSARSSVPRSLAGSGGILAIVAFVPAITGDFCVCEPSGRFSPSFVVSLVVVVALFLWCCAWSANFVLSKKSSNPWSMNGGKWHGDG